MNDQEYHASFEEGVLINREVAHVQDLKEVHGEDHEGKNLLLDHTPTFELSVINECEVVLFYPVLESEEKSDKEADQRVRPTESEA